MKKQTKIAAEKSDLATAGFSRTFLSEKPDWAISAAWSADEKAIFIVDAAKGSVLQYSKTGSLTRTFNYPGARLARIQKIDKGYLLQIGSGSDFLRVDGQLGSASQESLASTTNSGSRLDAIWGWTSLDQGLLGFGDLEVAPTAAAAGSKDGWQTGFLRINHNSAPILESVHQVDQSNPAKRFFLLGYPLLASVGSNTYALIMEKTPYILEVGFGTRRLNSFPKGFSSSPLLPLGGSPKDAPKIYAELARKVTATGLIGWKNSLYLLTRRPRRPGETEWTAWKIDPCQDKITASFKLPTTAEHIVVAPGPNSWAVIEKGPVIAFGQQDVASLLLISPPVLEKRGSV